MATGRSTLDKAYVESAAFGAHVDAAAIRPAQLNKPTLPHEPCPPQTQRVIVCSPRPVRVWGGLWLVPSTCWLAETPLSGTTVLEMQQHAHGRRNIIHTEAVKSLTAAQTMSQSTAGRQGSSVRSEASANAETDLQLH